ncbi:SgcJ/EcaC family oxidoreductase [Microtetraspora fusca]|uniref:SgcJ/EcaC family oxidoreductase n=1 Tax=Microtetraspora fusca TaxID=1997 RepID=UPI00082D0986|nr:SgcJ/EcaC family oxidoreductase [Microtetraspora fusca]
MRTDERAIRALIERWAEAVHDGDMNGVLADHAEDIVMFDVPPPHEGVRGLDAYRETWPPFFRWQAEGASFAIESLEVTAGDDVAYAYALLRCGTAKELADAPENRLRVTLGLRKEGGRWVVAHEHHSFPLTATGDASEARDDAAAEREVRLLHERWFAGTAARDLDGLTAAIAQDVVSYEHDAPLRHLGVEAVREVCRQGLDAAGDAAVSWDVPDLEIVVRDDLAVAWGLNRVRGAEPGGRIAESWSRGTRVFARRDGTWLMIHQHLSFPYDPATGEARTDLRL